MTKDIFTVYDDIPSLCKGFTDFIKAGFENETVHKTISLSGGNTPKAIFDYWSAYYKTNFPWNQMLFFWGDERCVPPSDEMSNYGMAKKLLFDKVGIEPANIFRIYGENRPQEEVHRYSKILDECLEKRNGIPGFDILLLGLGEDGHTASIFPENISLWDSSENCVVSKQKSTGIERVSISGKIINNAQKTVFLVTGNKKAEKIKQITGNRDRYINEYPAAKVAPSNGEIFWFLDKEAASLL